MPHTKDMKQYSMNPAYSKYVRKLEKQGLTTSDAQGVADIKYDPNFAKTKALKNKKR